jgi:hypothetical protein
MPADHPWTETTCFELPTIARHGVGADCVSISVKVLNSLASGTVMVHQVELQENLVDNPSMEAVFVGVPPLPPGWVNVDLDAGDTQAEAVTIHSGAQSIEWNPGAAGGEYAQVILATVTGEFYGAGGWHYGDGTAAVNVISGGNRASLQYALLDVTINSPITAVWNHVVGVYRSIHAASGRYTWSSETGAAGDRFTDDAYAVLLDDVTLTATAANQADSEE